MTVTQAILALTQDLGRRVTPGEIVEHAMDQESPYYAVLHPEFDKPAAYWANRGRLEHASWLIRHAYIRIVQGKSPKAVKVRALLSVPDEDGTLVYRPMSIVKASPKLRNHVLEQIELDLERLSVKYQLYRSFWSAVGRIAAKHRGKKAA